VRLPRWFFRPNTLETVEKETKTVIFGGLERFWRTKNQQFTGYFSAQSGYEKSFSTVSLDFEQTTDPVPRAEKIRYL
jgi:hypothetical protein